MAIIVRVLIGDVVSLVMNEASKTNPLRAATEKGLATVADFIAGTGFSRSKVQGHVTGRRVPSLADRAAYAKVLRLEPEEFDKLWFGDIGQAISEGMVA